MGEMIERVAAALFGARNPHLRDWSFLSERPGVVAALVAREELDSDLAGYRDEARIAIEAMREPTEAMVQAAWDDLSRPTPAERMCLELGCAQDAFKLKMRRRHRAMIDQALSEET